MIESMAQIQKLLREEGFKTSGINPFFPAVQSESKRPYEAHDRPQADLSVLDPPVPSEYVAGPRDDIYVLDPPIPRVAPFDLATIRLSWSQLGPPGIRVNLLFFYWRELEPLLDADPINELFDRHSNEWFPNLSVYFMDVESRFSLQWDTEEDSHIEDSLYGDFSLESPEPILSMMRMVRGLNVCRERSRSSASQK